MGTFYIGTSLENRAMAERLAALLVDSGHRWTHDWTEVEAERDAQCAEESEYREMADNDLAGVINADLRVFLMPGRRGTHAEIGAALATRKFEDSYLARTVRPILIWYPPGHEEPDYPCVFHYATGVERLECELPELLVRCQRVLDGRW